MTHRSWQPARRRRTRLTRRGRLTVLVTLAVAVAAAITLPLLLTRDEPAVEKPRTLLIPEGWRAGQV